MSPRRYLIAATFLLAAIFAAANLLAQSLFAGARADFTENNLYTLSDGTKSTLSSLSEPIDLTGLSNATISNGDLENFAAANNTTGSGSAGLGGGILNRGDLQINNSRITGNSTLAGGGGVFNYAGNLTISTYLNT